MPRLPTLRVAALNIKTIINHDGETYTRLLTKAVKSRISVRYRANNFGTIGGIQQLDDTDVLVGHRSAVAVESHRWCVPEC